jgi:hypothetical protein
MVRYAVHLTLAGMVLFTAGCAPLLYAGAGAAGASAAYEAKNKDQLDDLEKARNRGDISDKEYETRKDDIQDGSAVY